MMTIEIIEDKVMEMLEDLCNEKITDTATQLQSDLHMNSLQLVMMVVMIEETFNIELDESDMNPFKLINVHDIIELVKKYVPGSEVSDDGEISSVTI